MTRTRIVAYIGILLVALAIVLYPVFVGGDTEPEAGFCPGGMELTYSDTHHIYTDSQGQERTHPATIATCEER